MNRALVASVALATLAAGGVTTVARAGDSTTSWNGLRAGVGVADATWHIGSGAGQYASDMGPRDPKHPDANEVIQQEWDPSVEHVKQQSSYGVASRLSIRAIVVQDGKGDAPVALVKDDNYLAQDELTRRVGQLLAADGSKVTYDHILMSATHDHNSPYYATPAAGVWLFQDAMDLRMFEYQARQMASAIETAERGMVPARVGGTTVQFPDFQGNIAGADRNEDGSPAGYPAWDNDHGLVVLRFDNMSDPSAPKPLATYINYAQHGESLDGYNLISADWLAPFQRFVDRMTGVPMVFSQGSVGSAEGPYDYANPKMANDGGDTFPEIWAHEGYAQAERGTHLMAERVVDAFNAIGNGDPTVQAPYATDPTVTMLTHWVAGPLSHPYPSVGNCRTGPTGNGDPGVPAAGLPDCQRASDAFTLPIAPHLAEQVKQAGVPLPDNYDATAFSTVEENLRIKLQAVRIGGILLASCSCEAQSDLIKNLETRTDNVVGNQFLGFDYAKQSDVDEGWPADAVDHHVDACFIPAGKTDYSCPDPHDRWGNSRVDVPPAAFHHMEAEINNDAAGWNDPSYAAQAGSEPADIKQIKGNFTHTELGAADPAAGLDYSTCRGYDLSIGLGHTGDYDGYTVSYREYQARDAYRKALTSYGPHTADYMVTNLVGMAANLMCGTPLIAQATDPIATADEQRQNAEATLLGQISSAYYQGWQAQLPDNAGPARVLAQPWSVSRFDVTQFRWVGGDNYTDNPTVSVQRLLNGTWTPYADQSGEVQVMLDQPQDVIDALPTYRSGQQQWNWRASLEVFHSYPLADVPGGQVPTGIYRFHVDGNIHTAGAPTAYHLNSQPFAVSPWTGITARDLKRDGSQVSFVVDPVVYPSMPTPAHRAGALWYDDPRRTKGNHGPVCELCTFRPWATTGHVVSAVVQVNRGNGRIERVPATYDASTGRWVATVPPGDGITVSVPAGGIRDTYGETNAQAVS